MNFPGSNAVLPPSTTKINLKHTTTLCALIMRETINLVKRNGHFEYSHTILRLHRDLNIAKIITLEMFTKKRYSSYDY